MHPDYYVPEYSNRYRRVSKQKVRARAGGYEAMLKWYSGALDDWNLLFCNKSIVQILGICRSGAKSGARIWIIWIEEVH